MDSGHCWDWVYREALTAGKDRHQILTPTPGRGVLGEEGNLRILVCGGREFTDYAKMDAEISKVLSFGHPVRFGGWPPVFISGAAPGADSLIIDWAARNGFDGEEFPADWAKHGKSAGPIRNQQMLDECHPDLVVAFPGGKGTADMVARARKAKVQVWHV